MGVLWQGCLTSFKECLWISAIYVIKNVVDQNLPKQIYWFLPFKYFFLQANPPPPHSLLLYVEPSCQDAEVAYSDSGHIGSVPEFWVCSGNTEYASSMLTQGSTICSLSPIWTPVRNGAPQQPPNTLKIQKLKKAWGLQRAGGQFLPCFVGPPAPLIPLLKFKFFLENVFGH